MLLLLSLPNPHFQTFNNISRHQQHDVVWLLHSMHKYLDCIQLSTEDINTTNRFVLEMISNPVPIDVLWPITSLLDQDSSKYSLFPQLNQALQNTEARIKNNSCSSPPKRLGETFSSFFKLLPWALNPDALRLLPGLYN
jgi:hypothetical protein